MDTTQVIIIFVTLTLTVLVVALSIQVLYILKEMRRALQKVNKMLDDFGTVTGSVSGSVTNMSGFLSGLKSGLSVLTAFKRKESQDE